MDLVVATYSATMFIMHSRNDSADDCRPTCLRNRLRSTGDGKKRKNGGKKQRRLKTKSVLSGSSKNFNKNMPERWGSWLRLLRLLRRFPLLHHSATQHRGIDDQTAHTRPEPLEPTTAELAHGLLMQMVPQTLGGGGADERRA